MEHHRKPPFAGYPQLGAQRPELHLARGTVHEVEPRFSHGLHVGKPFAERRNLLHVSMPRVYARCAELDSRARRAVGVYVDIRKHGDDKCRNLTRPLRI